MKLNAEAVEAIRQEIRSELRECALFHEPRSALPPPFDLEAEGAVLASVAHGYAPPTWLKSGHFFGELNRCLFIVLDEMRKIGVAPTPELIAKGMAQCGVIVTELETALAIVDGPIAVPVERYARTIVHLARRRWAIAKLDHMSQLLRLTSTSIEEISAVRETVTKALDSLGGKR